VLLYELALELGLRSTDVVARAQALGMAQVGPSSKLTPEEVARLREAITGVPQGRPLPPPGGPALGPTDRWQGTTIPGARAAGGPPGPDGAPDETRSPVATAVIAVVVLLVVALFGYMATHTGDGKKAQSVAAGDQDGTGASTIPDDPCAAKTSTTDPVCADVDGGIVGAPVTSSTTLPPGYVPGVDTPKDKGKFCKGARGALDLEQKMIMAPSAQEFRDVIVAGKAQWLIDAQSMLQGAPPRIEVQLDLYTTVYGDLMAAVTPGLDEEGLYRAFIQARGTDLSNAAVAINGAYAENCR
jgi:hypothetical protein